MASISYPTNLSIPGPWLLDAQNLRDLDTLIASCIERMSERRGELLNQAMAQKIAEVEDKGLSPEDLDRKAAEFRDSVARRFPFYVEKRRLVVYMTGGRSADGRTFEDLATIPHVTGEIPRGFALNAAVGGAEIKVGLGSSWYDRALVINVSAEDEDLGQELFGKMGNWVSDIQPRKWLQLWLKAREGFFIIPMLLWFVATLLLVVSALTPVEGPSQVRQQAWNMARQGVTPANEAEALRLILAIEAGYEPSSPPSVRRHVELRYWLYWAVLSSAAVAFALPPSGAVGLWGGKRVLEWQRWWIRIVSVSVPSIVGSSILLPMLLRLLGFPT